MLGMRLTAIQRRKVCRVINTPAQMFHARLDCPTIDLVEGADGKLQEGFTGDAVLYVPFPGGIMEFVVVDEELIKAIKHIRNVMQYDSGKIGELLDDIGVVEEEEIP